MIDESKLRHPLEQPYFVAAVVLNFVLMAFAIVVLAVAPDWMRAHPVLHKQAELLSGLAIAALVGVPFLAYQRNVRVASMRGWSVRASRTQFAGVYEILEAQCRVLGLAVPPQLYITDHAISRDAMAYSAWKETCIVLDQNVIAADISTMRDVIAFDIGAELGRIRLGHTNGWQEMLITYVVAIPFIGNPLRQVRTYSRDRYAATLAPDGFRGLLMDAVGRRLLGAVGRDEFLDQARHYGGGWVKATRFEGKTPPVLARIQELRRAGFESFLTGGEGA
jgi:hypothetical protein